MVPRSRLGAAGLAFVVAVLAATPSSATPARPTQTTSLELVSVAQPWLHEDEVFEMHVRIDGAPADATVRLERHDAVTTRNRFDESDDNRLGEPAKVRSWQLGELVPTGDGGVDLAYPMAEDTELDQYGVYPMRLLVEGADGSGLAELVTYLVLLPSDDEVIPLDVAVVMEVGAPTALQPDGTVDIGSEAKSAIADRIEILSRTRQPVTVAPLPETLDALADVEDIGLLNGLRGALAGRAPLARPYVDLDLDALVSAELFTELPPEAEAGAQVLRNRFKEPIPGIWLSGPTLGNTAVNALRDMRAPYAVLPESAVASVPDVDDDELTTTPFALAEGGPTAFVEDEGLASRLTSTDGALGLQRFLAELALVWMNGDLTDERGLVVRVPEQTPLDEDLVTGALEAMAASEVATPVALRDLFQELAPADGDDLPVAELAPHTEGPDLRPLVDPRGRASALVGGLAGTLDDKELVNSLHRSLLISLGSDLPDSERMRYVNRVFSVVQELADQISAPEDFQITLTARDGTIPLTLTNDSDRSVRVKVHLESNQLTFPKGRTLDVPLPPGTSRLDIEVRTRTSGAFPLDISITSPDDSIKLDETTFTIRSTAVSGAGVVLSAGAGLFLLIWWARHWRTAQRSKRLVGAKGPKSPGDH